MVLRWSLAGFNVVYDRMRKGRWSWGEGVGAFGKEKTARKLPNFSSVRESETNILAVAANGQVVVGYVGEDKKKSGARRNSPSPALVRYQILWMPEMAARSMTMRPLPSRLPKSSDIAPSRSERITS